MAEKNPHAVTLGSKGGKARAAKMTPEQRSKAARRAIKIRWKNARALAKQEPAA